MTDINIDGVVTWLSNWFQDKLISGTNIKTINNQSLLGSGNISVGGSGGGLSFDDVYPVGSIYMSANDVDPSTLFGGTWERIQDRFLLAKGENYGTLNATGGATTVSLTQSQMPRHTHTQNSHKHEPAGDYPYFVAVVNSAVNRISTAGQTGTKVQNLLQCTDGVARVNTNSVTATNKYTGGSETSESASNGASHENMPPYLVVNIWKRTA